MNAPGFLERHIPRIAPRRMRRRQSDVGLEREQRRAGRLFGTVFGPAQGAPGDARARTRGKVTKIYLNPKTGELAGIDLAGTEETVGCLDESKHIRGLASAALVALAEGLTFELQYDESDRCIWTAAVSR